MGEGSGVWKEISPVETDQALRAPGHSFIDPHFQNMLEILKLGKLSMCGHGGSLPGTCRSTTGLPSDDDTKSITLTAVKIPAMSSRKPIFLRERQQKAGRPPGAACLGRRPHGAGCSSEAECWPRVRPGSNP